MKRTLFKIDHDQTKGGRTINALLALLTANRYALIFTFRLTLVKRSYQPEAMRRRAKENLLIFLVLFPLAMVVKMMCQKCQEPDPFLQIQTDSLELPKAVTTETPDGNQTIQIKKK